MTFDITPVLRRIWIRRTFVRERRLARSVDAIDGDTDRIRTRHADDSLSQHLQQYGTIHCYAKPPTD
ncbi:MAG TPA: hypothetical protein VK210_01770 [Terriglobia bacterium]|nr:hypothetical protein [Terriglobia bacterium]